jgi:hypothetical protein
MVDLPYKIEAGQGTWFFFNNTIKALSTGAFFVLIIAIGKDI